MKLKIDLLKEQIAEQNLILNSLSHESLKDEEKIYRVNKELDRLLYLYFKSLKNFCSNTMSRVITG